jgi:hypothetical protein
MIEVSFDARWFAICVALGFAYGVVCYVIEQLNTNNQNDQT